MSKRIGPLNWPPKPRLRWRQPCSCCGGRLHLYHPVVWDGLAEEWELSPELRRYFDEREGQSCASCRANLRVQHLTNVLLADVGEQSRREYKNARKMAKEASGDWPAIAEINELAGLHKFLQRMPAFTGSEYGSDNSEDLMCLSYEGKSFDYVLTSDTLEHVPDFDLALSEIRRVLRDDGKFIFSIPVIWDRVTRQRAKVVDGETVHLLPPSYHGAPQDGKADYLVFHEFGGDIVERLEKAGFMVEVDRSSSNPLLCTFICSVADG